MRTHYEVLGVPPTADTRSIRRAYHRLAKKVHPDKNPKHSNEFLEIHRSFEVLSDPAAREIYDRELARTSMHSVFSQFREQRPRAREVVVECSVDQIFTGCVHHLSVGDVRVAVPVPRGAPDGYRAHLSRLPGVVFVVRTASSGLQRAGRDLVVERRLQLRQLVEGYREQVRLPDGSEPEIVVAARTWPEDYRVQGRGLFALYSQDRGDLVVKFTVELPAHLTPAQRRIVHALICD
jgi:DnaJ-class molecular chaperone